MTRRQLIGILAALAMAASACSHGPARSDFSSLSRSEPPRLTKKQERILVTARSLIGAPYRYGGTTPKGFDCSGYVNYVFRKAAGMKLPRMSRDLAGAGKAVRIADLRPADLVYFRIKNQKSFHVGIYLGRGKFIHAPSSKGRVNIQDLNLAYWSRYYRGARRFL